MRSIYNVTRRDFLKSSGVFVLGVALLPSRALADVTAAGMTVSEKTLRPNVVVGLATDGTVTVVYHLSEMGQQVRTSLAQIVADELEADWGRVIVEQAQGDPKYGNQSTGGSSSVRRNFTTLRQAGASARTMLERAAADGWDVPLSECHAANHEVLHGPSGLRLSYGSLAEAAGQLDPPAPETVTMKPRKDWRYIGRPTTSVDVRNIVQGQGEYGIDVQLDGMKVAVIARPPVLFGNVKAVDTAAALAILGVERVVVLPALEPPALFKVLGGVAVVATNTWAALKGREALRIKWEPGPNATYDSAAYRERMIERARRPGRVVRRQNDVDRALAAAHRVLKAEYYVPHLAQAPMEPPVATARVANRRAEIWASTQNPQRARREVARALGFDAADVQVNVTLLGGGFGRKSKPDYCVEAALLSREVGAPVKVMWAREDDLRNGYWHTVSAQHIEAALDDTGRTTAWLHRTVFPSISATFAQGRKTATAGEMQQGFVDNPFDIANMRLENGEAEAHVRIGWLRSVANVYHAFAVQSFAHELAVAAGRDPKDYLLELIGPPRRIDLAAQGVKYNNYGESIDRYPIDTGRLANVVRLAADRAGWGRDLPKQRGVGIAAHRSYLTYVATVVEVEVSDQGELVIPNVWIAIDAGTVVNPDHVSAQCEGGSVYGLSCALGGEITIKDGAVQQSNFFDYLVARMPQAPQQIDVHIVESDAPPGGVGEPATPPFAPALCNAIHAASGKRIRQLPIGNQLRA